MLSDKDKAEKLELLGSVFSPTAPILSRDLFFGRIPQLEKVLEAIDERGQHVVLFGDRGVGKTSLANIIATPTSDFLTSMVTCNRTESFRDIWAKLFKRISFVQTQSGLGFNAVSRKDVLQMDLFLPETGEIDSSDILNVMEKINNKMVLIFDEYDSITSDNTKARLADTIKALSDNCPYVTLVIVGIADSVSDLVGVHPSVERCIKQVRLPRMSDDELGKIIDGGLIKLDMKIDPEIRQSIIEMSNGFPHYTHLLSKYSAKTAIQYGPTQKINRSHLDHAIAEAIDNANESLRQDFQKAVLTTKKEALYESVLSACALVELDEYGSFRAMDLGKPLTHILGRAVGLTSYIYCLGKFCQNERGEVIQKIGSGKNHRYRFKNPLLRAFVRLKLYQNKQLNGEL
jgi:hypothetical protein